MYLKWSTVVLIKMSFLYEHLNGHINITSNGNFNQSLTAFSLSRLWLPDQADFQPRRSSGVPSHPGRGLALFLCWPFTSLSWPPSVLLQKHFFSYKWLWWTCFKIFEDYSENESTRLDIILLMDGTVGTVPSCDPPGHLRAWTCRHSRLFPALLAVLGHS